MSSIPANIQRFKQQQVDHKTIFNNQQFIYYTYLFIIQIKIKENDLKEQNEQVVEEQQQIQETELQAEFQAEEQFQNFIETNDESIIFTQQQDNVELEELENEEIIQEDFLEQHLNQSNNKQFQQIQTFLNKIFTHLNTMNIQYNQRFDRLDQQISDIQDNLRSIHEKMPQKQNN